MSKRAFTLIELLVVISIIALLVGILLPALGAARRSALEAVCKSNSRQVLTAIAMHSNDHEDDLPIVVSYDVELGTAQSVVSDPIPYLQDKLTPYIGGEAKPGKFSSIFRCPSRESVGAPGTFPDLLDARHTHYRYNWQAAYYRLGIELPPLNEARPRKTPVQKSSGIRSMSIAVTIYDTAWSNWPTNDFLPSAALNVGYADSHVGQVKATEYKKLSKYGGQGENSVVLEWQNAFLNLGWPYPDEPEG